MGRVRPALRAYAGEGHGPAEALRRLDALLKESDRPEMTTVFLVEFDAATGSAEYIRAGHPPALLRRPDGRIEELAGGGTPPLGILDQDEFVTHRAELEPGSVLLLYTDGLIERRDEPLARASGGSRRVRPAPADADACLEQIVDEYSADADPRRRRDARVRDRSARLQLIRGPRPGGGLGSRVTSRARTQTLVAMVAAAGIVQLPTAAIVVALPTIHAEFDTSLAELQWTVTAFYIPFAALLIAAGRLADIFGRRRMLRHRRAPCSPAARRSPRSRRTRRC